MPHNTKKDLTLHSLQFIHYLRTHQAAPDIHALENYNPKPSAEYPNVLATKTR